jgi:hypothetical protein
MSSAKRRMRAVPEAGPDRAGLMGRCSHRERYSKRLIGVRETADQRRVTEASTYRGTKRTHRVAVAAGHGGFHRRPCGSFAERRHLGCRSDLDSSALGPERHRASRARAYGREEIRPRCGHLRTMRTSPANASRSVVREWRGRARIWLGGHACFPRTAGASSAPARTTAPRPKRERWPAGKP